MSPAVVAVMDRSRLRLTGALTRVSAPLLHKQLLTFGAASIVDLSAVPSVDSAGLATLAQWMSSVSPRPSIVGFPDGLAELKAAYRLSDLLELAR